MVYYAYFHSIMNFVFIFGGNSHYNINIFRLKKRKKVIRIITGSKNKDSCSDLFRKLNILTLQFECICSLVCFITMSRYQYKLHSDTLGEIRDESSNSHHAVSNLTLHRRGTCHMGFKICSRLPAYIKNTSQSKKKFKSFLKNCLHSNSFCTADEYFRCNNV